MNKLNREHARLLWKGVAGIGWLLIGMTVYTYLAEVEAVGIKEVIVTLTTLSAAGAYWLVWAKPKLQAGQSWIASSPLLITMIVSLVVEVVWDGTSLSLAWLAGSVAVGLGSIVASYLLSAGVQVKKEVS